MKKKVSKKKNTKKVQKVSNMKTKKRLKIRYKNVFKFFVFVFFLIIIIRFILHVPIQNISIKGNSYLTEEEIIKLSSLEDYPPIVHTFSLTLEKKLEKAKEIKKAKVSHPNLFTLQIEVEENRPLYFDVTKEKTILADQTEIEKKYDVPALLNYIPEQKYKKYIEKMGQIDKNIIEKISEIQYSPNDKDEERFLLSMRDGNYVYLTLSTFDKINHYLEIMTKINKNFNKQKGILYLDSGGYFEVME